MSNNPGSRSTVLAIAAVLLTAGLAGCIGSFGSEDFATFEDAREQAHTTVELEGEGDLRLGLIEPTATTDVPQGQQNVTFVLWEAGTDEPVEDAEFTLDAFMPMMAHGTEPEADPEHLRNGVYRGSTNLMMDGDWLLHLNATLSSGQEVRFPVEIQVAGGGHGDHDHGGMNTTYDSYEDAKAADGETFAPEQNTTHRLKLLEPEREGLDQGETNVTFLLYDEEADEPVTDGQAFLNATMAEMDHGTSPETDPMHAEHGVWKATTTLTMNGTWVLGIDVIPEGEDRLTWEIDVTVGNGSMQMDEPAFEPYEEVFEDDISGPDYDVNHTLPVEGANATLTMNGSLADASPIDEVTVELYDTGDEQLGSLTLTADTNESSLTVEDAPQTGDYTVRVHGTALDASYRIVVQVAPP